MLNSMKTIFKIFLQIIFFLILVSCGNHNGGSKRQDYLSREVSYYATPSSDAFGYAIKLDRSNQSYCLYENSFRNKEWRVKTSGQYSERLENNVAICDLHIEPELLGDVYEIRVYINADKAAFISISSQIEANPCDPIQ